MQQGKPLGLAKNARGGICPAGRERTFEGAPLGEEVEGTTKIAHMQAFGHFSPNKMDFICCIGLGVPVNRGNRNTGRGYINPQFCVNL